MNESAITFGEGCISFNNSMRTPSKQPIVSLKCFYQRNILHFLMNTNQLASSMSQYVDLKYTPLNNQVIFFEMQYHFFGIV